MEALIFPAIICFCVLLFAAKSFRVVPEQECFIIEQFGKYRKTLGSGFHFVAPFVQRVAYKHILKEEVIDVEPQVCITNDNVQVTVDGILYLKVVDPLKASYGIENYHYATCQLAKTTMRSEVGKIVLDRTFSERDTINDNIVKIIDEATDPWGIKVTRYEIKDITPTFTIEEAMERQMRAEREKRASILESEGLREAKINVSKGERQESINISMGEKQRMINIAEGRAKAIEITSTATAEGLSLIAKSLSGPNGMAAMSTKLAEQYIAQFSAILGDARVSVLPADVAGIKALLEAVLPRAAGDPQGIRSLVDSQIAERIRAKGGTK